MALKDISRFQLKRVNPFQGLVIDAEIWQDAHRYHRDQQRLHTLVFHEIGIVEGLEVTASDPPDLSVNINPGIAIDPEGNVIIVPQTQRYRIQTGEKGLIHLIIQFREVPSGPNQPPDGGQPTRILEAYRIQEREKLPDEPHLELARVDFDPAQEVISNAKTSTKAGKNEINLSCRQEAKTEERPGIRVETPEKSVIPVPEAQSLSAPTIELGHAVLGGASEDLHGTGLKNLVKAIYRQEDLVAKLEEHVSLDMDMDRYTMLYLSGNSSFELTAEQQAVLGNFIKKGGVIFGESCSEGQDEKQSNGAKEFGLAFNQLANQLKCKLEMVQRGHPLLSAVHVFSEVPPGAAKAMLLEGGNMIYSGSDYACAWQGGYQDQPLPRDIIRNSIEMGVNIVGYATMMKEAGG